MTPRTLAAAIGLAALATLGTASLVNSSAVTHVDVVAGAHPSQPPTSVKPTVPSMELGITAGETTTATAARPVT